MYSVTPDFGVGSTMELVLRKKEPVHVFKQEEHHTHKWSLRGGGFEENSTRVLGVLVTLRNVT